ncbi:unnamed protein product [Rodentolepis nana]|uniref:Exocyst complex component Sec8 n=1 Tax=Rodentolepis nana TaxID=102285 RepID=A0A0R3TWR6_RODNA|nr:unnamed protein product [Rodentolepis nana]
MKRDIGQCKSLLSFNRDELRRLWLELVEQRRSMELIEVLDRVKSAPEILKTLIAAKAWPEATEYLIKITEIMTKEVDHVPALDVVKSELAAKKKLLIDEMRTNLFYLVFNQPIALIISEKHNCFAPDIADQLSDFYLPNRRYSSINDDSVFGNLPLSDWRSLSSDAPEVDSSLFKDPQAFAANLLAKRQTSSGSGSTTRDSKSSRSHGRGDRSGDFMITDKKKWAESIVALTHCLHRLQKLSQAFYTWRMKVQNVEANSLGGTSKSARNVNEMYSPGRGLITEVHNSITLPAIAEVERILAAQGETSPASTLADPTCLVELLQLLFPAFCMHFNAFMLVLNTIKKIRESTPNVTFQFLDALSEEHIWGYIQMEVQSILSAHLSSQKGLNGEDLFPSSVAAAAANFNPSKLDLNALMGKKRGAITSFLSNVTGDSNTEANGSSSNSATGGEESTLARNGEPFFSFSKTAHSLSLNSYLRENRINMPFGMPSEHSMEADGGSSGGGMSMELTASYPTVCRPCADNVKVIYSLVLTFARLIELQPVSAQNAMQRVLDGESNLTIAEADVQAGSTTASGRRQPPPVPARKGNRSSITSASVTQGLRIALLAMGAPKILPQNGDTKPQSFELPALQVRCQLRVFLTNFIEQLYLPNAEIQLQQPIISAVSSQDALTMIVPQQTQRELGLQRPILMVAYLTNQALGETKGMATALPNYMLKCAQIGLSILEKFVSWTSSVYKSISVSVSSGAAIPSAEWARDKDLSRFWTNFPVWQRLMAADAFAAASTTHTVGNPHDPQLGNGITSQKLSGDRQSISSVNSNTTTSSSNLSAAAAIVLGLSNLGLNGRSDPTFTGGPSIQAIPFANSALGQGDGIDGASDVSGVRRISKHDDILLHERETTRLARKEMDNLLHIIRDEVGSSTDFCLPTAGMLTIKSMGRLRESVHWLELCVQNWLSWLESSMESDFNIAPFVAVGEELTALANATLLSIYLDVRVQAYNLLANLPRTANFWCPVDEVDVDPEITKCLVYWDQLQESIVHAYCPHEIRFIFDGLGDFISQIFLRLIPQITRMNVNGNRKMCRNIYKLQQTLALLTENHESDLIRVKQLYELFYLTPESVVNKVIEQGVAFEVGVYQNLLRLYQRSHPSHDHSRTDDNIAKLSQIIHSGTMSVDEFNKRTRKLCLSRRNLFKGTPIEQLYNRLQIHSPGYFAGPNCCSEVCLGCYRTLAHADRKYRLKSVKRSRNRMEMHQVKETFTCRYCKVRVSAQTTIPKAPLQTLQFCRTPKATKTSSSSSPSADIFNLSSNSTPSSSGSGKKSRRRKKRQELAKEVRFQQASAANQKKQGGRSSLNDFLELL